MWMVLAPVISTVLLGPGVGQLINKEYKKASILIALSLMLLVAFSAWLTRAAMGYLPQDINTIDRAVLRNIIQTHIVADHPFTFYTYEALLAILWLYGIIDAYKGGMRRQAAKLNSPTSSTSS